MMRVQIIYEYEIRDGATVRGGVIAENDEELTEYIARLVLAQYTIISARHID